MILDRSCIEHSTLIEIKSANIAKLEEFLPTFFHANFDRFALTYLQMINPKNFDNTSMEMTNSLLDTRLDDRESIPCARP